LLINAKNYRRNKLLVINASNLEALLKMEMEREAFSCPYCGSYV